MKLLSPARLIAFLLLSSTAFPCSWAIGYFSQVTRLRGKVVGVRGGNWFHPFRRIRQLVVRDDVTLTLYKYCHPCRMENRPVVKLAKTDLYGRFDFGGLPKGHYTLVIQGQDIYDMYDVEVLSPPKPFDSVVIDVSPNYPDCTGGHEFRPIND